MKQNFQSTKNKFTEQLKELKRTSNIFSFFRFFSFAAVIVFIVVGVTTNQFYICYFSILAFLIFFALSLFHNPILNNIELLNEQIKITDQYIARVNNDLSHIVDDGSDLLTKENQNLLTDFDVVGKQSFFHLINICRTGSARKNLVQSLVNKDLDKNSIISKQAAIKELAENEFFNIHFEALLNKYVGKKHSYKTIKQIGIINIKSLLITRLFFGLGIFSSMLFFSFILASSLNVLNWAFISLPIIIQFGLSLVHVLINRNKYDVIHDSLSNYRGLYPIFDYFENVSFNNNCLSEIAISLTSTKKSIKKAELIGSLDGIRNSIVPFVLCNLLFPLTILTMLLYCGFETKEKNKLDEAMPKLEYIEQLSSFAVLPKIKDNVCLPIIEDTICLDFENLKSPLVKEDLYIGNSFRTKANTNVITGSNMSGKSSFMRAIGLNLMLLNAGGYVTSEKFSASLFCIFSSMRVKDDLQNGISTFYGEILRIKEAFDYIKENKPMLILVDEIFKGTNFNDRLYGASNIIEKLCHLDNCVAIISTHDFELCDLKGVVNYHFKEYYNDDIINFDYKIYDGKCDTTNARYLMKKAGIIKE